MTIFWVLVLPISFVVWFVSLVMASPSLGSGTAFLSVTGATVVFLIFLAKGTKENLAKMQVQKDEEKAILRLQATNAKKPNCSCVGPAVALVGSHGSTRRFAFSNPKLANVFSQLNAKKVIH